LRTVTRCGVWAAILAATFVPLAVVRNGEHFGTVTAVTALLLSASLLAIASAALFHFEMRTVVCSYAVRPRDHD
jgi:hypothetical protein